MTHSIESLTAQQRTLLEQCEVLLLVALGLQCNTHQIDGINLNGADRQSRTADGVDERIELGCVRKETATVTERSDIATDEEVAVVPSCIVVGAPTGEVFIDKLAVLVKETVS